MGTRTKDETSYRIMVRNRADKSVASMTTHVLTPQEVITAITAAENKLMHKRIKELAR